MALNTVLVLAAGLGLAGAPQDPSLDTQIVTPVLGASQSGTPGATATTQNKVTVQFRGVKASEVFSWLENRGVNFVVSQGDIAKDATVSLNLQDVTLDAACDSIARALGGHWEKENGIRVFKKGESPFRFFSGPDVKVGAGGNLRSYTAPKVQGTPFPGTPPDMPKGWAPPLSPMPGTAKAFGQGGKNPWGPGFDKDMEAWSKQFAQNFGPEQQKAWEKEFGPEFQRRMEEWSREFSKRFGAEFQQQMRKMAEEMRAKFGENSEFRRKLIEDAAREGRIYKRNSDGTYAPDKDAIERFRRQAQEEGARARVEGDRARREAERARTEAMRDAQRERSEAMREAERARAEARREADQARREAERARLDAFRSAQGGRLYTTPRAGGGVYYVRPNRGGTTVFRNGEAVPQVDIKKFLRNLTPDQRDRQRKRGFIWWDDLTREQKALFGDRPEGKFEIHYKINDDEITIRGN